MFKPAHVPKSTAPTVSARKKLRELFDDRNGARARSKEEKQAAEKILGLCFPMRMPVRDSASSSDRCDQAPAAGLSLIHI